MLASEGRARVGRVGGRWRGVLAGFGGGLVAAVLFGLAFPPFGIVWLALACLVPLMLVAGVERRWGWAGVGAAVGSMPMWAVHHVWVWEVSSLGMPALVGYLGLWWAMFVWCVGLGRAVLERSGGPRAWALGVWPLCAVGWIGQEWLRGEVAFHGYAWFLVGHPLIDWSGVRGLAGIVGQYGVGLLVAGLNAALAAGVLGVMRRASAVSLRAGLVSAATAAAVFAGALWAGTMHETRAIAGAGDAAALRIGVVQTNVPQSNKTFWSIDEKVEDFRDFVAMTARASRWAGGNGERADAVVWPETMFPGPTLEPSAVRRLAAFAGELRDAGEAESAGVFALMSAFASVLREEQATFGVPMLVGSIGVDGYGVERVDGVIDERRGVRFNSVYLLRDGEVVDGRYDKLHLTPFGEVMPYISAWTWLERRLLGFGAEGMAFDLAAGPRDGVVFDVGTSGGGSVGVVTPVCFELTVARVCRRLVFGEGGARRAGVMVQVTNDGWFGGWSGGKEHHLLQARWRAAELRTPVVRAANTGISAAIGRTGRVLRRGVDERFVSWREAGATGGERWRGAERIGHDVGGVLRVTVRGGKGVPTAARIGEGVGVACGVVVALAALGGCVVSVNGRRGVRKEAA